MGSEAAEQARQADEQIRDEILKKFLADQFLKNHDIQVIVEGGVVTLSGIVASPLMKDLAKDLATSVNGVIQVQNNIDLGTGRPGEETRREAVSSTDASFGVGQSSITHAAEARLRGTGPQRGPTDSTEGSRMMDMPSANLDSNKSNYAIEGTEEDEQMAGQMTVGMQVVDRENYKIGLVKEIRGTDFLLNRSRKRDVYVPYYACTIQGNLVVLNVLAKEIGKQGWSEPRIV